MKRDSVRVLIVAAHPDDEVLGCGGAISKHTGSGDEVAILILGEGLTSRFKDRNMADKKGICDLKDNARKAAGILGAKGVFFSDFPDNNFDSIPILKIIKEIERVKRITKPDIIYTHHYGDLNIDHCITYKAVLTAARPIKGETVREIYSFEVPSSTEWSGPEKKAYFTPNTYIDITKALGKKTEALECYRSELRPYPHPRSVKAVKSLAMKRGSEIGVEFAESFEAIRLLRI